MCALLVIMGSGFAQPPARVPEYVVDPYWPQPLPNNWLVGAVVGVAVDRQDDQSAFSA